MQGFADYLSRSDQVDDGAPPSLEEVALWVVWLAEHDCHSERYHNVVKSCEPCAADYKPFRNNSSSSIDRSIVPPFLFDQWSNFF